MRSEGIKCLEPEHKADFSGLNFFWKSCENTAQLESKTSNWGESEVPVLHLTTDRHFSVQNKGFSDQLGKSFPIHWAVENLRSNIGVSHSSSKVT